MVNAACILFLCNHCIDNYANYCYSLLLSGCRYLNLFQSQLASMEVPQFNQAIKELYHADAGKLADLCPLLKQSLHSYKDDLGKVGHAIYRLTQQIMKIKDVKNQCVEYYEDLICEIIKIAISLEFRVGFDAMRFVFNCSSDYYKTANIDLSLVYPLGKDRPLQQHNPVEGEQCDTVKPYITSTSFCGWTRCTVLEVENQKYTIKYANYNNPNTVREKPWFAPLGERTKDYDWRMGLEVGAFIDAFLNRVWYKSTIVEVGQENGTKKVRVTYRRFDQNGDRQDSQGNKYFGLGINQDEWIDVLSPRIQQQDKMSDIKLCYYTFSSQQILQDDSYDICFQREYKEKPFYSIMRMISCKSLSMMKFINTFEEYGGIQKVLQIMEYTEFNDDIVYFMLANIGGMVQFFPRMFIKTQIFFDLYSKIGDFFFKNAKTLNPNKIDMGYYCYDQLGRRLFSLTEVYQSQNELKRVLVKEFLKLNMQKQLLALRYLGDLMNPKKQYTSEERQSFNKFLKDEKIFQQIFNANTHQQIISRTGSLLEYLIKKQIISEKQFESLWKIVPPTDIRGRSMIEKLLTEISRNIPVSYVEFLINKILALKENQLTIENLNLLKELKNRSIGNDLQMKILGFLWDLITVKSANVKANIQEEAQKVFKAFVSTVKNPIVRMGLLEAMSQKLQDCKKIRNQIQLLKDFINSYPQKYEKKEEDTEQIYNYPLTLHEAVTFLKKKDIYASLLKLLSRSKDENTKRDLLRLFTFLFENDTDDINQILKFIYERLGPSQNFLDWIHKLLDRSLDFTVELLEKTEDFVPFQSLASHAFELIANLIIDVNKAKNKIKVVKSYDYSSNLQGPLTKQQTQKKFVGPLLPSVKQTFHVLVSPFHLIGMKFLQNLMLTTKSSSISTSVLKIIIQLISNLDESIQNKTEQFRRQFLEDVIREISIISKLDDFNEKIKTKLEIYISLLLEIFGQTEKNGLGNLEPHFESIEGEKICLIIENLYENKQKSKQSKQALGKFNLVCKENITIWSLKKLIAEIIGEKPETVDIHKYSDAMDPTNNGKSLGQLMFYDNEGIKIKKKPAKDIVKSNLLNEDGTDVSQKLEKIIKILFDQYKNTETNGLSIKELEVLGSERWKGSLLKEKDRLQKILQEHDKTKKGYLSYSDFKEFFYIKSVKNDAAVYKLINSSGFKNDLSSTHSGKQTEVIKVNSDALPRRILSCSKVYSLIFDVFENQKFKQAHLNFYKLLSTLQVNKKLGEQIQSQIYTIIQSQQSMFRLCYSLEIANSELAKHGQFYEDFWRLGGPLKIMARVNALLAKEKSVYELDQVTKNLVLPNLLKIVNMYVSELLVDCPVARFVSANKINHMNPKDFFKKIDEYLKTSTNQIISTNLSNKLLELNESKGTLLNIYNDASQIMQRLMKQYNSDKSEYIQKLTIEIVRLIGSLIASDPSNHNFAPMDFIHGVNNFSLNYRRSVIIFIYIYFFYSVAKDGSQIEQLILKLVEGLPSENKFDYEQYFLVLNELVDRYVSIHNADDKKDEYFICLANQLLDSLFSTVEPENRTDYSSNKIILGILSTVQSLIKKDSICKSLSGRKVEITEKCLFAYNIADKLQSVEITAEMLENPKQSYHFKNYVICKTDSSREAAYKILARLHQLSNNEEQDYLNKCILPIIKSINPEVRLTGSKGIAVGLKNFGSTCYMNSMLQVLNTVAPFRNSLMKCDSAHPVIKELQNLFASLYFSQRVDYAPFELLNAFVPPINPTIQQDTTEFLNFLFDQLEVGLAQTKYKKLLQYLFKGANASQMICHSCGYKKENKEEFFSFGVEIEGKTDLCSALEGSYQGEVISGYLCDSCQNRGETTKRNILSQIPNIMFIHLRRIVFNYDMFVNMKIHTRLEFPDELNIEPYTKEGVELREKLGLEYMKSLAHNEEETKKFEQMAMHGKEKDFYKMKLKGIIVHSGSADVGHYYSILQKDKLWRKFDDSRISMFVQSDFENECYGGTFVSEQWGSGTSRNAYVLIYEKVIKHPIEFEQEDKSKQIINYDDFKVYNSLEDYRRLWLDNHNYMIESQLLDSPQGKHFVNFVCSLLTTSPNCNNKMQVISSVIYNISFHSSYIGDLQKILYANIESTTPSIFYAYVLNKPRTFKLLFSHQRAVRDFMASYLQIVLFETFKKGETTARSEVIAYITELLNAMAAEVAKNWMRIDGYFKLIFLLVSGSINFPQLYDFFISRSLISTLVDFALEKQSPVKINPKNYSLGTKTNPMEFSWGLATILFLLKHSYGFTGHNYESYQIPPNYLFHLNRNDVICLSHMQFYRKVLRERQNLGDLAGIIHRLCIQNIEFSKAIIEVVLESICSITDTKDELGDYSSLCLEILKVKDEFWLSRAEMLLGVGQPYVINQNLMNAYDEQRFVFSSTICEIFPVECLLAFVNLFRTKNIYGCYNIVRAIVEGSSASDQGIVYLARQPSPTYLFPNLVSLMQQFVQDIISTTTDVKLKERLNLTNTLQLIKNVKKFITDKPEINPYQSTVTGEIVNKKLTHSFEKEGVEVKLYQFEVFYCSPAEISARNLAICQHLEGFKLNKPVTDTSNILKFMKKPGKSITLKVAPTQEHEDKQLVDLFDDYPDTSTLANENKLKQEDSDTKMVEQTKPKEAKQQLQTIKEIEVNLEQVDVCSYFRQIEVINMSKDKKVVTLSLGTVKNGNSIVPMRFGWKIGSKGNESLWMAKQAPYKSWDELEIKCEVEPFVKEKHDKKSITSWWFKTYQSSQAKIEVEQSIQPQQKIVETQQSSEIKEPTEAKEFDLKQCPQCTFLNAKNSTECEMCLTSLL